jgi:hypothetical protein
MSTGIGVDVHTSVLFVSYAVNTILLAAQYDHGNVKEMGSAVPFLKVNRAVNASGRMMGTSGSGGITGFVAASGTTTGFVASTITFVKLNPWTIRKL